MLQKKSRYSLKIFSVYLRSVSNSKNLNVQNKDFPLWIIRNFRRKIDDFGNILQNLVFFGFIRGRSASRTIVSGALGERNNCRTAQTVHAASENDYFYTLLLFIIEIFMIK